MPVNETKNSLRSALQNKSTEELEQLLAADFSEEEDAVPNVEYITTILEVIHEREEDTPEQKAEVEAAWQEFQAFLREEEQNQKEQTKPGRIESPSLDHQSSSESRQASRIKTRTKSRARVLRICAVAAAVIVLFCGSAYAAGWNIFQALAQWSEETFGFLGRDSVEVAEEVDPFENMRLEVVKRSDVAAVPRWAPEGTGQVGEIVVGESSRKTNVMGTFVTEEREFTVKISVYDTVPDAFATTYQKDDAAVQEYEAAGVVHYIMTNNEQCGVSWINGNIEGTIQGMLSVEELRSMIDSIYKG